MSKKLKIRLHFTSFNIFYKILLILYFVIVISFILSIIVFYFITQFNDKQVGPAQTPANSILFSGLAVAGILHLFIIKLLKKILTSRISKANNIAKKTSLYFNYFLLNITLVEIYGLLNIIFYFMFNDFRFIFLSGYTILLMLFLKPNPEKIVKDLQLTGEEKSYVEQPDKPFN